MHVVLIQKNREDEAMHRPYFLNSTQGLETLTLLPYLNMDLESYAIEQALLTFEKKNVFDFKYLTENLSNFLELLKYRTSILKETHPRSVFTSEVLGAVAQLN